MVISLAQAHGVHTECILRHYVKEKIMAFISFFKVYIFFLGGDDPRKAKFHIFP